jgi:thioredoxin reductase
MLNVAHWQLGQRILILGSGDVGMIMARQFTLQGKQVVAVLEQTNRLGGLKRNKQLCLDAYNIPLVFNATVSQLHGSGRLSSVSVASSQPEQVYSIECDTLVTSIGLIPELELLHELGVATDGQVAKTHNCQTNLPWLFMAGNAHQIQAFVDNVVDDGNLAGTAAARYLKSSSI